MTKIRSIFQLVSALFCFTDAYHLASSLFPVSSFHWCEHPDEIWGKLRSCGFTDVKVWYRFVCLLCQCHNHISGDAKAGYLLKEMSLFIDLHSMISPWLPTTMVHLITFYGVQSLVKLLVALSWGAWTLIRRKSRGWNHPGEAVCQGATFVSCYP